MNNLCRVLLLGLALAPPAALSVRDVDGRAWSLLAPPAGSIDLLFIVGVDCPISNRYAPEIGRICHDYQPRGVRCFLVYPDSSASAADVKKHRDAFGLGQSIPAIIDSRYALTDATGARVTPEAAVFTSAGRAYDGRIDDMNLDVGQTRRQATRHDLRLALDAVVAGKPVAVPETKAVGCFIERR